MLTLPHTFPSVLVTEPPGKPVGRPQGEGVRTAVRPGGFELSRAAGAASAATAFPCRAGRPAWTAAPVGEVVSLDSDTDLADGARILRS
jgi:hypothetical protein